MGSSGHGIGMLSTPASCLEFCLAQMWVSLSTGSVFASVLSLLPCLFLLVSIQKRLEFLSLYGHDFFAVFVLRGYVTGVALPQSACFSLKKRT